MLVLADMSTLLAAPAESTLTEESKEWVLVSTFSGLEDLGDIKDLGIDIDFGEVGVTSDFGTT